MSTLGRVARAAVADLLADVEHRRLVALAFADDHGAAQVHEAERLAHRLGGRLIGPVAIAAPHEPRRGQRRRLGHANDLQCQVSVHGSIFLQRTVARDGKSRFGR